MDLYSDRHHDNDKKGHYDDDTNREIAHIVKLFNKLKEKPDRIQVVVPDNDTKTNDLFISCIICKEKEALPKSSRCKIYCSIKNINKEDFVKI